MRNKQAQVLLGISGVQVLGIVCAAAGIQAGIAVAAAGTAFLVADAVGIMMKSGGKKVCPRCKADIPKQSRICPECGHRYRAGVSEDKLTEYIEQEKEKEMTSEQIDCDFEKIESIAVDEVASYDGDIEEFLKNRCRGEEII